jgi:hypothetical protein
MIPLLDLIILTLAVARVTRLVTTDVILEGFRDWIWKRFGDPGSSKLGYLITCDWCTSIYAASLLMAMYKIAPNPTVVGASVLAMSMVAGAILNRVG